MRLAGIVLGLGLGGFVDGIALHQIMQWHNMARRCCRRRRWMRWLKTWCGTGCFMRPRSS